MVLQTFKQIETANKQSGQNFFSKEAMRFFGTKIESPVFFTNTVSYFITSEQDPEGKAWFGNRRYTIRIAYQDGNVDTVGNFGQYFDYAEAKLAVLDFVRTL